MVSFRHIKINFNLNIKVKSKKSIASSETPVNERDVPLYIKKVVTPHTKKKQMLCI